MNALRFGVLSTAQIGLNSVIPAIQQATNCEVVAIASRDATKAQRAAADMGIERAHGSYDALLADDDVDAVYNPLPNHLHLEWSAAAARAGKHVLCEKPLTMSVAEAEELAGIADGAGVKLMEAFMYRLHPQWERTRELIADGAIGEVTAVQSWFSYDNDDPGDIRNVLSYGGGGLMDIGCYTANLSRMLMGAEPDAVSAAITTDPTSGVDILTSAILGFGDRVATFTVGTQVAPGQHAHIFGAEGRIDLDFPFTPRHDRPTHIRLARRGADEAIEIPPRNQYTAMAEQFADAVADGGDVPIPVSNSIANMATIERVFAAAGIAWPPR